MSVSGSRPIGSGTLTYPTGLSGEADYVTFTHYQYRTNRAQERTGAGGGNARQRQAAGAPAEANSPVIRLYMPTSTPGVVQGQSWGEFRGLQGALGEAWNDIVTDGTVVLSDIKGDELSSPEKASAFGTKAADTVNSLFKENTGSGQPGNMARQAAIQAMSQVTPMSANQLAAVSRGEIFNPNVEMLYAGPSIRGFNFQFNFVPKSPAEAQVVNNIIRQFKIWSTPSDTGNGMYSIPHIWQVQYCSANGQNRNMNLFKPAAITSVNVQANPDIPIHMAFTDGQPVTTAMALTFTEVDVITREDQEAANNSVGF